MAKDTIVGGDGAWCVKEGASYVNGQFQLDRYHLNREPCNALGKDEETKHLIWSACDGGKVEVGLGILAEAAGKSKGEQAQRIAHAYRYLQENSTGLVDYRIGLGEEGKHLRRTGAIEGNVDKLVVRRMKNQGISWTIKGIRRLLCVRIHVLEGGLHSWLQNRGIRKAKEGIPIRKVRRVVDKIVTKASDDWLMARLPVLRGPHSSRPWAKALKKLTEAKAL